jgi:hypothetical protein
MSVLTSRRLLWIGLMLALPLPMLALEDALVPVARFLLLGGVCIAVMLVEDAGGVVGLLALLFLAHAVVYAGLLWLLAFAISRGLGRLPPRRLGAITLATLVLAFLAATATRPYRTPFGRASHGSLIEVLQ